MEDNVYFRKALADFTYETAAGGAIRHLADTGYTVKEITEALDFPVPYERVRRAVWKHFVETGVILTEEPGTGVKKERAVYVREFDKYGKPTFRRVTETEEVQREIRWKELRLQSGGDCSREKPGEGLSAGIPERPSEKISEELSRLLERKTAENGEQMSYISFDFGVVEVREPERYREMLSVLEEKQREYVEGLSREARRIWHRADARMRDILWRLCGAGLYQGECRFLKTEEKLIIPAGFGTFCFPAGY